MFGGSYIQIRRRSPVLRFLSADQTGISDSLKRTEGPRKIKAPAPPFYPGAFQRFPLKRVTEGATSDAVESPPMQVTLIASIDASFAARLKTISPCPIKASWRVRTSACWTSCLRRVRKACERGLSAGSAAQRKVRQTQQAGTADDCDQHTGEHVDPSQAARAALLRRTIQLGGYPLGTAAVGRGQVAVQRRAISLTGRVWVRISVLNLHRGILSIQRACAPPTSRETAATARAIRWRCARCGGSVGAQS